MIFWFEQILFNKVDFTASNFEAAVGLQIEAAGKMKVAARVLEHRTIQNYFVRKKKLNWWPLMGIVFLLGDL